MGTVTDNLSEILASMEENLAAKSAFIAHMSHDMKGPIASNIALAKLIETTEDMQSVREYARMIQESSEELLILLNDILEMAADKKNRRR